MGSVGGGMKFILIINVKMRTIVGILTFIIKITILSSMFTVVALGPVTC